MIIFNYVRLCSAKGLLICGGVAAKFVKELKRDDNPRVFEKIGSVDINLWKNANI